MVFSLAQQHLFSYFNLIKVSSLKSLLEVLEEIKSKLSSDVSCTPEQLREDILQINREIKKFDLEIVEIVDEITCEKLFVLISTGDNVITQKSKFYDDGTSQLFSKVLTNCVLSEEGHVSETDCLNFSSQLKMTKSTAQSILEKLIQDKWLVSVNDKISLGMRSIAELEQSIKQHYPDDVKNCPFCKLIVIQGHICDNCKIKCHFACWKKYHKLQKTNYVCPGCKEVGKDIPSSTKIDDTQKTKNSRCDSSPLRKKSKKSFA